VLAYDIARALPGLRREAEGRMIDRCIIRRPGGDPVFDPGTGDYIDPPSTVVYSGKCEVQVREGLQLREVEAVGTELSLTRKLVKLPDSVTTVKVDDLVETPRCMNVPALVAARHDVIAGISKTRDTYLRLH